jgi:hypothetical protein
VNNCTRSLPRRGAGAESFSHRDYEHSGFWPWRLPLGGIQAPGKWFNPKNAKIMSIST